MDYKKEYDEMVQRVKELHKAGNALTKKQMEIICPALAESEDERIRKELIDALKASETVGELKFILPEPTREECIAYLEKQKEQKHPDGCFTCNEYKKGYEEGRRNGFTAGYNKAIKEVEQKEQKPEHFELKAGKWYICHRAFCCRADHLTVKEGERFMCEKDGIVKGFVIKEPEKYFKECSAPAPMEDEQKEQKLAEWSEEDEENFKWFDKFFRVESVFAGGRDIPQDKYLWFKSLRPQPKQEWSEDYREEDIQTRFAFYTYKEDPCVLYLSNVFVEESSRNHGFGTRILKAAEKVAEVIGATTISLKVKQNSPANTWYRKNGYSFVTSEDGYDWLKKNLEYFKPKEFKQNWSDEDENHRQNCLKLIKMKLDEKPYPYYVDYRWLKSLPERLNLQPKQEWSEEDEEKSE